MRYYNFSIDNQCGTNETFWGQIEMSHSEQFYMEDIVWHIMYTNVFQHCVLRYFMMWQEEMSQADQFLVSANPQNISQALNTPINDPWIPPICHMWAKCKCKMRLKRGIHGQASSYNTARPHWILHLYHTSHVISWWYPPQDQRLALFQLIHEAGIFHVNLIPQTLCSYLVWNWG